MTTPAQIHPEEPGAVAMLDQAITALTTALDEMPINEVVNLKAKVATIQTATKELGMSKEAQELAAEAVRRSEWALRRAVNKAQAAGEVKARGADLVPGAAHGSRARPASSNLPSPKDFFSSQDEYDDANAMAALEAEAFEQVLEDAKAEGNLSRTNVARKAREKAGQSPAPAKAGTTERAHQEAELINAFGSIVRRSLTPKNVATLTPKARARLISILNDALNTLQETSS